MKKYNRLQTTIKILSLIILILLLSVFSYLIYRLISDKETFEAWLSQYGNMSRLIYIMIVALQVILALIPGEVLEIAGGYIFGTIEGTILNLLGATIGSILVFLLVRRFGKPIVHTFFSEEKLSQLRFLQNTKKRNLLLMLIFILPGTPKDLLCYFAGLTNIKTSLWLLICSLGRVPSVITSTIGGAALENESYLTAVIAFVIAAAISLLGVLIYHRVSEKKT